MGNGLNLQRTIDISIECFLWYQSLITGSLFLFIPLSERSLSAGLHPDRQSRLSLSLLYLELSNSSWQDPVLFGWVSPSVLLVGRKRCRLPNGTAKCSICMLRLSSAVLRWDRRLISLSYSINSLSYARRATLCCSRLQSEYGSVFHLSWTLEFCFSNNKVAMKNWNKSIKSFRDQTDLFMSKSDATLAHICSWVTSGCIMPTFLSHWNSSANLVWHRREVRPKGRWQTVSQCIISTVKSACVAVVFVLAGGTVLYLRTTGLRIVHQQLMYV